MQVRGQIIHDELGGAVPLWMLTCDLIFLVSKQFEISAVGGDGKEQSWLTLLDAVLKARMEQDPKDVEPEVWRAFLLFAFVLIPCVQSW